MSRSAPLFGFLLSGLVLSALPLVAVARHVHIDAQTQYLTLPVKVQYDEKTNRADISLEFENLNLDEMNGADAFLVGQTIYVHLARGPETVAYPFAVTAQQPRFNPEAQSLALLGTVKETKPDEVSIAFRFQSLHPTSEFRPILRRAAGGSTAVELAINKRAQARIHGLDVDGEYYPYRVIEKPELEGWTQKGARIIPAK